MEEESPPPPLLRPTPDHPPYSEMVQCAIKALAELHGSTEPSISSFIETHYDSIPWAHSKLLPYYLNKLILAGEIAKSPCSRNRYVLPGTLVNPNPRKPSRDDILRVHSPVKRGHRRPKKGIPRNAETVVNGGVDRAKLIVNPNSKLEIVEHDPAVKNGRGRPRKVPPHVDGGPNSESVQKGGGFGRGLIVNPSPNPNPKLEIVAHDPAVKDGRGRPRKIPPHVDDEPNSESVQKGSGNGCGLIVNPSPNPYPKLEIEAHDPAVKDGRGRPRKIPPHVDGEPNSESVQKGGGNRRGLIVNPSPNPNPEILRRGPIVKGGRGRPRKITPRVDSDPISELVQKGGGNGCGLIVNPSSNPEILGRDLTIKRGRGRPRKIIPHIDGEPKSEYVEKGSLNINPNPNHLWVGSPVKRRGRPPKVASLDFNREANHDPDSLFLEHEFNCSGERPRLVLKLKRRKPEEIGGDSGDVMGGWMCLKEEDTKEKELECVKVDEGNEEVLTLQLKDLNAVEVDEHFEELLALQEKSLSDVKIDEHDEGFLALQEKDLDWMQIDGHNGDLLPLLENGSNEIKTGGQNEKMLALEANGLNGMKVDEHNEELLLPLQEKYSNGIDRNNEELLTMQEKDLNAIKPDECSGDLLALEQKDLKGYKIDGHNEELLVSKVLDAESCQTKSDQGSQHKVVLDAESCQTKSDQGSLHTKAKPKKTKRLWYER